MTNNAVIVSDATTHGPTLELAIAAWLDAKAKRSGSLATRKRYVETIESFRHALRAQTGLDLDSEPTVAVGLFAQAWASQRRRTTRQGKAAVDDVSNATHNNRLAILSSFYTFARRRGLLPHLDNPIELLDRRPEQEYATAKSLDFATVESRLSAIDRRGSLEGARDYALLVVALHTGRRAAELAGLRYGDITFSDGGD